MSDPTSSIPEGEVSTQSEEELQKELEAELQKQIERHEAAVKLAKQREQEAKQAKERWLSFITRLAMNCEYLRDGVFEGVMM